MQIRRTGGDDEAENSASGGTGATPAASSAAPRKPAELSVSEVTRRVKMELEGSSDLRDLWIAGEASNVRLAASGHLYFTVKDANAQLRCVYFAYGRPGRKPPEEGSAVLLHGSIRVYERAGEYQLLCDDIIKAGKGDLAARFEELKAKLAAEGLFDPARKRRPPAVPRCIGVVTSPSTAALQDVLHILRRRAPYLKVILFPAIVQGDTAAPEIASALARADSHPDVEVILLVRGGGSIEDLWCFNDEALARRIAGLSTPVISGVGHEIDFTIADFVADLRAPTPSAAAELVAPDANELRGALSQGGMRLARALGRGLAERQQGLERLFDRRLLRDVMGGLQGQAQGVDAQAEALLSAVLERTHGLEALRSGPQSAGATAPAAAWYSALLERLSAPLSRGLERLQHAAPRLQADLLRAGRLHLEGLSAQLEHRRHRLEALDPRAPLELGFSLVWTETDVPGETAPQAALLKDPAQAPSGTRLRIETRGGSLSAKSE